MNIQAVEPVFSRLAQDPKWRQSFIDQMLLLENKLATLDVDIREEITGPLVDALFEENQVLRKTLSNGMIFEFLYRSKIARDFVMSTAATPDHVWEPQTSRLLVKLAAGCKQVVVGGAYFGDHALLIAKEIAAHGGVVHAFEPNNDQRNMLNNNARLNGLTNVIPHREGLWDNSTSSLKLVGFDSFAYPEAATADETDGFKTVTIADYLTSCEIDSLDLIMLDIEGAELKALQGALPYLCKPAGEAPNIVFEVHRHYVDWSDGLDKTEIVQLLTNNGYSVFAVRDFNSNYDLSGHPIELVPVDSVYLEGPDHGFNMVAVKEPTILQGSDFRVVPGVSPKLLRHRNPRYHHPVDGL